MGGRVLRLLLVLVPSLLYWLLFAVPLLYPAGPEFSAVTILSFGFLLAQVFFWLYLNLEYFYKFSECIKFFCKLWCKQGGRC